MILLRVLLLIAALTVAGAARAQSAATGEISGTSDADGFRSLRLRAGAMWRFDSPFHYTGAVVQTSRYAHADWTEAAPAVLLLWRRQDRNTLAGTMAEVGLVRVAGRTRLVGDGVWTLRPSARTGFEFIIAGDVVETRRALEKGTAFGFAAISGEHQFGTRFTVIGLAGYQRFTDSNQRPHFRARLIYLLVPQQGVTAQLRWRQFGSEEIDDPGYFNPGRYQEWQAAVAIRKRYGGWQWYGYLGAGRETIGSEITNPTRLVEVRAEGPLARDIRVVVRAMYQRAAGFGAADDYWYRSASINLVVPW